MTENGSSGAPAIRVAGLAKSFRGHLGIGRTEALKGLDLEVDPGQIFGLLGHNGAGKTTTLKMLVGLLRPDRGEVQLLGRPASDPAVRSRLGFLPENPYFYDYLTGREFLDFYARLQGIRTAERRQVVGEALERVGLEGKADRPLRKFSKGMLQRIGLAQAIQHGPELIILDEPMSGLDPIGRREVRDLILSLRAEGKTVFFSSHILQDAEAVCDSVAILKDGALCWSGHLSGLERGNAQCFEVGVEGAGKTLLPGHLISRQNGTALLRVETLAELTALLERAREAGVSVTSLWPRRQTLEDLFVQQYRGDGDAA